MNKTRLITEEVESRLSSSVEATLPQLKGSRRGDCPQHFCPATDGLNAAVERVYCVFLGSRWR